MIWNRCHHALAHEVGHVPAVDSKVARHRELGWLECMTKLRYDFSEIWAAIQGGCVPIGQNSAAVRMRVSCSPLQRRGEVGLSIIELLIVMLVLTVLASVGAAYLGRTLQHQETRGAAQAWQAACAWAQLGVVWRGGSGRVSYTGGSLSVAHSAALFGGELGPCGSATWVSGNVPRWTLPDGVSVAFGGALASPDGGGSIFFQSPGVGYRVVVRPVSGLTGRSWVGDQ